MTRFENITWYLSFIMWLIGGYWLQITADSFGYRLLGGIVFGVSLTAISYRMHKSKEGKMTDQRGTESAPGQERTYVVTHPTDPSSPRTVTQAQWREEKLGQKGWQKPPDMPEEA